MHTYMSTNSIFDGPVTNPFSVLCILIEVPSCAQAKGWKSYNDSKFGTFNAHFSSDREASTENVKGLMSPCVL